MPVQHCTAPPCWTLRVVGPHGPPILPLWAEPGWVTWAAQPPGARRRTLPPGLATGVGMLSCSTSLNTESAEEGPSQQNSAVQQQRHNTAASAEATITLRRSTFIVFITTITVVILILFGGVIITTAKVAEMKDLLNPGQTEAEKELPSLSRREGVVPDEVWRWIVEAKGTVTENL
ncbi:hypothetical protein AOLI_G00107280 [Acnodon oligacanthus]